MTARSTMRSSTAGTASSRVPPERLAISIMYTGLGSHTPAFNARPRSARRPRTPRAYSVTRSLGRPSSKSFACTSCHAASSDDSDNAR